MQNKVTCADLKLSKLRLASFVGITERETGIGKLGWHGNSTGFDRKNCFFLFCVTKEKRKIS